MPYDNSLAAKVRQVLGRRKNLVEKQMFGGVGFLIGGNICCGVWREYLILRLGPDAARQVLGEADARPFDITGRPMRGWAMIEPAGWRNDQRLRRWLAWAVDFTTGLPPKQPPKARSKKEARPKR